MTIISRKILAWSIFSLTLFFLVLLCLVFFYQRAYAGKIYRNVYFSDVNLAGKTKNEAKEILKEHFASLLNSEITLNASAKTVKAKMADTGLDFDFDKAVDESYQIGRTGSFLADLLVSTKTVFDKQDIAVAPFLNQSKYNDFLKIAVDRLNYPAQDASMIIEKGLVKITPSTEGQSVDTSNLINKIIGLANTQDFTLELNVLPVKPKTATADFETARSEAEDILSKRVTFTYNDKVYSPTKTEIGSWIVFQVDKNGKTRAELDDSNIKAYLNKIAINFQISRVDRKINSTDNSVIQEGKAGLYLDKDKTLTDLKSKVGLSQIEVSLITYTEEPKEIKVTSVEGFVPGKFEGRYLDVDLSKQKLCRVDGNTLVDCFTISSGKPGMATPTGTFTINDKNPRHWSGTYSMWLPWWQQFKTGGWGIHELPETATWKETDAHLGSPVSHGCVRLGVGPAQEVYNWTEIGTIVYVHK